MRRAFCVMFWYGVGMGFGLRGGVKGSGGCVWGGWRARFGRFLNWGVNCDPPITLYLLGSFDDFW